MRWVSRYKVRTASVRRARSLQWRLPEAASPLPARRRLREPSPSREALVAKYSLRILPLWSSFSFTPFVGADLNQPDHLRSCGTAGFITRIGRASCRERV